MQSNDMVIKYDNNCVISLDMSNKITDNKLVSTDIPFSQSIEEIQFPSNATVLYTEMDSQGNWLSLIKENNSLKKIFIPEGVKVIGNKVTYSCHNVKTITIPTSIEYVNSESFFGSNSINLISDNNHAYYLTTDGTSSSPKTLLYKTDFNEISEYTAPSSLKAIVSNIFSESNALEKVNLDCDIKIIPTAAFNKCTNLSTITSDLGNDNNILNLPSTVKDLQDTSFAFCQSITHIHLGKNIESIGDKVFINCTNLIDITIDKSVNSIEDVPAIPYSDSLNGPFVGCTNLEAIYVPYYSIQYYQNAENWKYYADQDLIKPISESLLAS